MAYNATGNATLVSEHEELRTTFYVGIASFTVLVWDHVITLPQEVEYVWKSRKSPLIFLFFINRYLTPLGFIVNLIAYFSNLFTPETCQHYVRYEGSMTVIGINTTALMMLIRVYAMYEKKKHVVALCVVIFLIEFITNAYLLTFGVAVPHSPGIHACTMIFDSNKVNRVLTSGSAWLPLVFDTTVLILTIMRTYPGYHNRYSAAKIMRVLLQEGLMYYSVIFIITFILTLMIVFAPDGLKNITAQTEYLMTVAMMSRITLHLKEQMHHRGGTFGTVTSTTVASAVTPIRFGASGRSRRRTGGMSVTIQESSVVHDDRGKVVPMQIPIPIARGESDLEGGRDSKEGSHEGVIHIGSEGGEWHELAPLTLHGRRQGGGWPDSTV